MTVEHDEYSTFIYVDKEQKEKQKTQLDITLQMMVDAIIELQKKVENLEKNIKTK